MSFSLPCCLLSHLRWCPRQGSGCLAMLPSPPPRPSSSPPPSSHPTSKNWKTFIWSDGELTNFQNHLYWKLCLGGARALAYVFCLKSWDILTLSPPACECYPTTRTRVDSSLLCYRNKTGYHGNENENWPKWLKSRQLELVTSLL